MKRHFTLLELLTVIMVISILIGLTSIFLPQVRERTRRVSCGNNLRNIGFAVEQFANEHKGYYPFGIDDTRQSFYNVSVITTGSNMSGMKTLLSTYLDSSNIDVWHCPSVSTTQENSFTFYPNYIKPTSMNSSLKIFRDLKGNHAKPTKAGNVLYGDYHVELKLEDNWTTACKSW